MSLMKIDQRSKNLIHRNIPIALSPAHLAIQYAEVLRLREQVRSYEGAKTRLALSHSILRDKAMSDRSVGATGIQEMERRRSRK
jgi:hypothetical protein